MSRVQRLLSLLRRASIVACVAAVGVGLYLTVGIAVTTDPHTGQERLNGSMDSSPLLAPGLLLLVGGAGLVLLLPRRRARL